MRTSGEDATMNRVTSINTLLVKPGQVDDFVASQRNFASLLGMAQRGLIGGRMYRSIEGSKTVLVSQFASIDAHAAIMRSAEFKAHVDKLRAMIESSNPALYEEAYTYGEFM